VTQFSQVAVQGVTESKGTLSKISLSILLLRNSNNHPREKEAEAVETLLESKSGTAE
jgi:hypothetical protein